MQFIGKLHSHKTFVLHALIFDIVVSNNLLLIGLSAFFRRRGDRTGLNPLAADSDPITTIQ